jgi:hypothetical protein
VAAADDLFLTEVGEDGREVLVQRPREVRAESGPAVALLREAEPGLLHLTELVPRAEQAGIGTSGGRLVPQKAQVAEDLIVQARVIRVAAVDEEERGDEERQVSRE